MMYARRAAVLIAVVAFASGCGADEAEPPPVDPSTSVSPSPTETPTQSAEGDASAELTDFVCAPDDTGRWDASGVLLPDGPVSADYAVTVVVTAPQEESAPGRQRVLTGLQPGTPVPFKIRDVPPVGAEDLTCQVKVVRLPG